MSGVAGLIERRGRARESDVCAMLDAMGPRSAGRRSIGRAGPAVLGVGHLPGAPLRTAAAACGRLTVIGDFRLDNIGDLAARMGMPILPPAELVLQAYRRWGEDCAALLEGDFAFALWDDHRGGLFHARDGFGVKPFHYYEDDRIFAFASEPKAIIALRITPRRVSEVRIAEFLEGAAPPPDQSFYADIRRLAPGACGWADLRRSRRRVYWALSLPEVAPAPGTTDAETFFELFDAAVRRRLPPDGSAACLLSGGLDSSAISCVAQDALPAGQRLDTVSVVFDGDPAMSERPFIDTVLAQGRYRPAFINRDGYDPFDGFDALLAQQDGLFLAPNLPMLGPALRSVPAGGILLDGHGGDEVVSKGGGRLHDLAREGRWGALWRELAGVADLYGETPLAMFATYFQAFGPGRYKMRAVRRALSRIEPPADDLLSGDLRRRTDVSGRLRQSAPSRPRNGSETDFALLAGGGPSYALEVLDRAASAAGIETRFPFWDRKLIEFSLSLAPQTKLSGGWTRLILRQALDGRLPSAVQWRRDKRDFSPLLVRSLVDGAASNAWRQGLRLGLDRFVNLAAVERARQRLRAPRGRSGRDVQAVWRATALAHWLAHADARGVRIVGSP